MSVGLRRQDIDRLLADLDAELVSRGTRADLFLVGGAAIAVAFDARRATRDLDAAFEPTTAVREAAGLVAEWKLPYWIFKTLEGMSLACNPFPYLTDLGLADGLLGELVPIEIP